MKRLLWLLLIVTLAACGPAGPTPTPTVIWPPNLPVGEVISAANADSLRQIAELQGHRLSAFMLAFSPPCPEAAEDLVCTPYLASISDDGARLWDLDTRTQRAVLGEGKSVSFVFFSGAPPGKTDDPASGGQVVTVRGGSTVEVWRTPAGALLRTFEGHTALVGAAALAPDGVTLALGGEDGAVMLWDITTGEQLHALDGHADPVVAIAYAPDGSVLASAGAGGDIRLWDVASGEQVEVLSEMADPATTVAFAPDGKLLAAGAGSQVRVWALDRSDEALDVTFLAVLPLDWGGAGGALAFSPDGAVIAVGGSLDAVTLWNVEKNLQAKLPGHKMAVLALDFSPDGSAIVTTSADAPARVWRLSDGQQMAVVGDGETPSAAARFSPDGRMIAVDVGGAIQLWGVP